MVNQKEIKFVSKKTGLTGVESKTLLKQLERKGLDYQSFDWKTIGENLYGHGKKFSAVKKMLREMYGISISPKKMNIKTEIEKYSDMEVASLMPNLMKYNDRRRKKAKMVDWNLQAKTTFSPTNKIGVKKWKKHPNLYDIMGIDDKIM